MAAIQHILTANQQRRCTRSPIVYINAYVRQHFSPLNVLSDRAVQSKYRIPCVEIQCLVTLVSPHVLRATRCNFALSPEVQLLAVLSFYAVGRFLEVVEDGTGLSKAWRRRIGVTASHSLLRPVPSPTTSRKLPTAQKRSAARSCTFGLRAEWQRVAL